ncbi:FdhF/YdeP family oxidoreductase [Paraburkholderia sabiae]|uniref:FdhF/YdeP family oxidoreductase n=1 Tax=Paraburkholderia sabiae TaxID=273251 RepID=A0ABU9Q6W8_9BURK|nr:FdhF/YdeP family oxidoreductase [Paraburkholderia sabiae]WJZ79186.1 FdhF/YdeP family oxidoreductase [Paraburkholderia sabiae]CAD6513050.1 Protein YdeP [Paraburkholderia sabiae]
MSTVHKKTDAYQHASGGWGSVKAVAGALMHEGAPVTTSRVLVHQNKTDGFMCVSCSWAKPAHSHPFEFCESGAKATAWDMTSRRVDPEFFAGHTLSELETWHDHDLEEAGRLCAPMRWDAATDKYVETTWEHAFGEIGRELRALDPDSVVFYTSGRASLETSYMYQLFARMYGTNNLPDSSNMCHESTSVGLTEAIGVGVGTITLDDFKATDLMFFFGQNVGTNSPRMLHDLQEARERGVPIITFNPLREPGLVSFVNPQSPAQMVKPGETQISTQYHQVRAGGDSAAIAGICKAVIEADDQAKAEGRERIVDVAFIDEHTTGFDAFADYVRATGWEEIEQMSGLPRAALIEAADEYMRAKAVIAHYGMGLTQHRMGVQNVRMIVNLLLLRGNIGKPGAGPSPIRGHSNVQGQRTVGITEKPKLAPLDKLAEQYRFEPPRETGMSTVDACKGVIDGRVRAVMQLGGNLVRSVPDRYAIEPAWRKLRLTVNVATKLNRSHLVHGEVSYLLPCLSRIEIDVRGGKRQAVAMEDSTGCMHGSRGVALPASDRLLSEQAIVAGIAMATLDQSSVDWQAWSDDYALVRDAIAETYPDIFHDFNARLWTPGGFHRPLAARERKWKTKSGKAEFAVPESLNEDPDMPERSSSDLRLFTLRSDSQFNTTIYRHDDRFRGISGTRMVVLMNPVDIARHGLDPGMSVSLEAVSPDGVKRQVDGFTVVSYDVPVGCAAGYYPECNPLIPLSHHAKESKVPAAKSVPVRVVREPEMQQG